MHLIPCAFLPVLIFPVVLLHFPDILQDCLPVVVCLLPVAFGNGSNNVMITVMAAVYASLLAKNINNNILAALRPGRMVAFSRQHRKTSFSPAGWRPR